MFTGLIQDVGVIEVIERRGDSARVTVRTRLVDLLREGDSLALNGVCLTVEAPRGQTATAVAVAETLDRSTLGSLARGDRVHLEPALRAGEPMGGHVVQGHVDGVGSVVGRRARGVSLELTVQPPPELLRYVVEKGSIAIDGASLTVASVEAAGSQADSFSVALVPHTLDATVLKSREVGAAVNIEVDILAKYVERMIEARLGQDPRAERPITEEWLREKGF